ncbi:hypothetical protein CEE69_00225 [Rhodopirellula bahusiensis]|uniref:Uncharacterized protein n=1 Tax=Rhodopirellula bahusiensis TaxID=2014065 RepID=A0A2G1WCU8_9BACT|nr:hypothetical protein CEE69_00225 [Rhodopirellula bahusiensis]
MNTAIPILDSPPHFATYGSSGRRWKPAMADQRLDSIRYAINLEDSSPALHSVSQTMWPSPRRSAKIQTLV